jgi:glutathione S-transferase
MKFEFGQVYILVIWLNMLLLLWTMFLVGRARSKTGIKAPAMVGHPDFERAVRAQMNTIEQTVLFLPTLLLCAMFFRRDFAAAFGLVWLLGRIWYVLAYIKAANKRGPGFLIAFAAWAMLFLGAGFGIFKSLFLA